MGEGLAVTEEGEGAGKRPELFKHTVEKLPGAMADFAADLWSHKGQTTVHVVETVATSAAMGIAIGYILPTGGPAGWLVGAAFTAPLLYGAYKRIDHARTLSMAGDANLDRISRDLARDTVSAGFDLGLTFAGGWAGAEAGHAAASAEGALGRMAQQGQRTLLKLENETLSGAARLAGRSYAYQSGAIRNAQALTSGLEADTALGARILRPRTVGEELSLPRRELSLIDRRLDQYLGKGEEARLYFGSLHGHSKYSDGMGTPAELFARAKQERLSFTAVTDHNHLAARDSVKPGDPRSGDQAGVPTVAENPIEYAQTFADAAAATADGEFVALVGTEMGTIGKVGGHHGGVNHINLLEVPTFFEAIRQPRPRLEFIYSPLRKIFGIKEPPVVKPPEVVKYNDGDYSAMVTHLDALKDTTGGRPVIQLNHPRYLADESAGLPAADRGRDYGQKSFKTLAQWREKFGKYVSQIELIKGEALNPKPVETVKPGDLDPTSFAGYLDKGLHLSPTFGRDFHFGNPGGNPAGTGILSRALDKASLLEALRERRTIATTDREQLSAVMSANDRFAMGSILDQAAVQDLAIKVKVGGNVVADAAYKLKLWGDKVIGDGKRAEVLQETEATGADLIRNGYQSVFDAVKHKLGKKSAYYVEVQRTDPVTAHTDRMWTAPIWVEPLTAAKHGLWLRGLVGDGSHQLLFGGSSGS